MTGLDSMHTSSLPPPPLSDGVADAPTHAPACKSIKPFDRPFRKQARQGPKLLRRRPARVCVGSASCLIANRGQTTRGASAAAGDAASVGGCWQRPNLSQRAIEGWGLTGNARIAGLSLAACFCCVCCPCFMVVVCGVVDCLSIHHPNHPQHHPPHDPHRTQAPAATKQAKK